ncbi:MAG: hypothetical protein Q7R81_07340 [Candidatus Peregrinibacteria bacterium]|nr:hypothetical protein [Candidatus Peregrinibacteria bacterium]
MPMQSILDKLTQQVQDEMQPISGGLYSMVKSAAAKAKQFRDQQLVPPEGQPIVSPGTPEERASVERAIQGAGGLAQSILAFPGKPIEEALVRRGTAAPLAFVAGFAGDLATPGFGGEAKRVQNIIRHARKNGKLPFLTWFKDTPDALAVRVYDITPNGHATERSTRVAIERMGKAASGEIDPRTGGAFAKREPITIDRRTGKVIDGDSTLAGLKEKGVTHAVVRFIEHPLEQPITQLLERGKAVLSEFTDYLTNIARSHGAQSKIGSLKGLDRSIEKIVTEEGDDVSKLYDGVRGTVIASPEGFDAILRDLTRDGNVVGNVSDKVRKPTSFGFRGLKMNRRMSNGVVAEAQVVSPEVARYAAGRGHKIYEEVRPLLAKLDRGEVISASEKRTLERLQRESVEGYQRAWDTDTGTRTREPALVYDEDSESYVARNAPDAPSPPPAPLMAARPHDPFYGPPTPQRYPSPPPSGGFGF